MGSSDVTKTKLTNWDQFYGSIKANERHLYSFRGYRTLDVAGHRASTAARDAGSWRSSLGGPADDTTLVAVQPQVLPPLLPNEPVPNRETES